MSEDGFETDQMKMWEPVDLLRSVSVEKSLSIPFERLPLARWFPGVLAAWQTWLQRLSATLRSAEAAKISAQEESPGAEWRISARGVPDAQVVVRIPGRALRVITEVVLAPTIEIAPVHAERLARAETVILEYLVLRGLAIWNAEFTGTEELGLELMSDSQASPIEEGALWSRLPINFALNERPVGIVVLLNEAAVGYLAGLWERDILGKFKDGIGHPGEAREKASLVVATLGVPRGLRESYLRSGTIVDLEVPVGGQVLIEGSGGVLGSGELCRIAGNFGLIVGMSSVVGPLPIEEGSVRLSVSLGSWEIAGPVERARLHETGAVMQTLIPLGSQVDLLIDGVSQARAQLLVHEGRMAYQVM